LCKLGLFNNLSREEEKVLAPEPVLMPAAAVVMMLNWSEKELPGFKANVFKFICSDNTLRIESGFLILWLFWIIPGLLKPDFPTLYSIFIRGIKHASKEVSLPSRTQMHDYFSGLN
jgi:hypothetical protein